jgi:predicted ester cyclase
MNAFVLRLKGYTKKSKTMNTTEVARLYHETWNGRDADAMVSYFTKDGTFCNPDTYPGISREDLANFVKGVWTALPDFSIELLNAGEIQPGLVAHHWLIRGTNTGPGADGTEPTGRTLSFKGVSLIQVEGDKIRSDQCYFDRKALDKQLQPN